MTSAPYGIYHQGNSIIHTLSPFCKIICMLLLIICVISSGSVLEYGIILGICAVIIILSHLRVKSVLAPIKRVIPFFIVIITMNTLFYSSENAFFKWWIFTPSADGFRQGLNVALRVIFLLIISNILTMTTPPVEMTKAIEQMIYPLKFIKIPVSQIAMILSLSIQFITTLTEEAQTIRLAQQARGAQLDSKKITHRIGATASLLLPIFLSSFKRADELSLAMESRGYRVSKSRKIKAPSLRKADIISLILCALPCIINLTL